MPEKIEQILRAIHIILSRGEMYNADPDKVIVSKREMFDVLEQLNYAVVEVMDNYEATTRAKEKAKRELEETGQNIIDAANSQAEDIYAASLLYTDGALNEVYADIVEARSSLRKEYNKFENEVAGRLEVIKSNQQELMDQLRALSQGKKYLDLIDDYNKRIADAEAAIMARAAAEAESKAAAQAENGGNYVFNQAAAASFGETGQETGENPPVIPVTFRKKKGGDLPALDSIPSEDTEDIDEHVHRNLLKPDEDDIVWPDEPTNFEPVEISVNNNWGTRENNVFESGSLKSRKERDREKKQANKKPVKKKSKYDFGDEEIQLTVDPDEDPETPKSFNSADLDAEYVKWLDSNENQPEDEKEFAEKNEDLLTKASELFTKLKKK